MRSTSTAPQQAARMLRVLKSIAAGLILLHLPWIENYSNIEMVKAFFRNNESILWESQGTAHPNTTDDLTIHTYSLPAPAPKR